MYRSKRARKRLFSFMAGQIRIRVPFLGSLEEGLVDVGLDEAYPSQFLDELLSHFMCSASGL